jgi:predicted anti-sigma-YlaC factor YlaD
VIRRLLAKRRFMRDHAWTQAHLSDWLDGELQSGERARVDEHVHLCPECRRVLESLRRTVQALMELRVAAPATVAPAVIARLRREEPQPRST